jgi:DNA-binding Lrp family transcriptional regulator
VVVYSLAVLRRDDSANRADEEFRWQAGVLLPLACCSVKPVEPKAMRQGVAGHPPRAGVERGRGGHLSVRSEVGVDLLLRVSYCRERQLALELQHRLGRRVEHDDLTDSGPDKVGVSAGDGPEMQIADRTAGVAAELYVHQSLRVRYLHRVALDGHEFAPGQDVSGLQLALGEPSASADDPASVHFSYVNRIGLFHFYRASVFVAVPGEFNAAPPDITHFPTQSLSCVSSARIRVPDSDNLYSRILRELYSPAWLRKSGRESYVGLAKKLGIDDQTVRTTIGRMQKSGFLKAWSVTLNPHVLGMECESVVVSAVEGASSRKDRVISQLKLVEGVVAVFSFLDDPGLRLVFYYGDDRDLERRIRLVSSICGVGAPSLSWKTLFPPCKMRLKKTDWEIVRFLLKDSRKSVSQIAKGIGVSTRTVGRRLAAMTEDRSFFINPIVDVKKVDGFMYHFVVSYDDRKDKEAADDSLQRSIRGIVFADTTAELHTVIGSICQNISEARKVSDFLRSLDGVKEVTVRVFEDIIPVHDWIDHEIEKHLRD